MIAYRNSKNIIFVILFLLLTAAGVIVWELIALPYSDDWFYMFTYTDIPGAGFLSPGTDLISTPSQAIDSFIMHYVNFGSRLTHLFAYFTDLLPPWLNDIIDGIAIIGLLMLIVSVAFGKDGFKSPIALTTAATLMWITLPWHDNMVSHLYQINYVWSSLPALWFLYIYLYRISTASPSTMRWAVVSAFFTGAMHEGISLPTAAAAALVFISQPRLRKSRIPMLIGLAAGIVVCLGPGTFNRLFYGQEATFDPRMYRWLVSRAILSLLPWLLPIGAMTVIAMRKGLATAWHNLKTEWPWLLIAIANYAMALIIARFGRTLWMMDLSIVIVTLRMLASCSPSSQRVKTAVAVTLAALNIAFLISLCREQKIMSDDQRFSIDLIKTTGCREIYTRIPLQQNAPWWTLGIPHRYDGTDDIAQYTLSAAMDSDRITFYPILPVSCVGKPFEQWPKIAGDNPFRGEFPNLYSRDSLDLMVKLTVGAPLPDMSPANRLLALATGKSEADKIKMSVQMLWNGDSGKIYKYSLPNLPRTIKSRKFISLDIEN